jgi:hypothetical protein
MPCTAATTTGRRQKQKCARNEEVFAQLFLQKKKFFLTLQAVNRGRTAAQLMRLLEQGGFANMRGVLRCSSVECDARESNECTPP